MWLDNKECNFTYRHSIFGDHPHWVILAAKLQLEHKPSEEIYALMRDRLERRKTSQPLDKPSAGSCFRNPDNGFAWELIDGIGYRGYKIGNVCVSNKHSNFIINDGDGCAEDYLKIAYKDDDILYVPLEQYQLIRKYVSKEGAKPKINRLGSKEWEKTKAKIKQRVDDIAEKLVSLYANRANKEGFGIHLVRYLYSINDP